jgi:RNA polymerase sigma-70 factor (sigma-E family)
MGRRDEGEFLAFAAACRGQLRRTAYLLCGDWDRAADLTQEALIRLYVAWPRLRHRDGLGAYARKAVVSAAIDHGRRRSSRELVGLPADHQNAPVDDPSSRVVDRLVRMDALASLPPRQRACVVLRYYEDLGVEAVADLLGCGVGTVKSQTSRGLATLRAAYSRTGGELTVPDVPATPPAETAARQQAESTTEVTS